MPGPFIEYLRNSKLHTPKMFASSFLAILLALTSTAHAACSDHEVRLDCKSGGCPKEEATCPEGIEGVFAQNRMVTRYSCDTTLPVCLVKVSPHFSHDTTLTRLISYAT